MKSTPVPSIALQRARTWIAAAIFQGDRLMALATMHVALGPDPTKWTAEQNRKLNEASLLGDGSLVVDYESFCFLVTLRMVRRWLTYAKQSVPSTKAAIEEFETVTAHAVDVRDMHEHEDAYLVGTGNNQKEYMYDFESVLKTSAHSVILRGDDYIIAGRVSVPKTLVALRKMQPIIDAVV